ncbi:MAG TPA: ABC transporter permease [Opitutaceae bacterium]|nr:ABC transporter permease [Opitutaceae bacterium]
MRILLTLLRKDIANFLRNKTAVILTFVVPVMLIYVFGFVWGLNRKGGGGGGPSGVRIAVVNQSDHPGAQKLVEALQAEKAFRVWTTFNNPDGSKRPLTEADARTMIQNNDLRYALIIPKNVISSESFGIHLRIFSNPQNTIESQTVNGLLQKTIFSNVPKLLGDALKAKGAAFIGQERFDRFNDTIAATVASAFDLDKAEVLRSMGAGDFGLSQPTPVPKPADPSLRRIDAPAAGPAPAEKPDAGADLLSRLVKIETTQLVGKDVKSPQATNIIGGQAIMFLLFALSGGTAAFFDEKNTGIFQRLLAAPVSRGHLLWSRFLFGVLLGLVQLMALFFAGQLLYGVDVTGHFVNLVIVCIAAAASCTAFSMFVAAFSPNAQAASGLATLLVMAMSATGGAWFPMTFMPEFMQQIGKFTVVYWSMEGFSAVLWAEKSFVGLLPVIGILSGIAVGVMAISVWRLNRRAIFG